MAIETFGWLYSWASRHAADWFQSLKGISGNWDKALRRILKVRYPLIMLFQSLKGISGNWDDWLTAGPANRASISPLFQSLKGISGNWDLEEMLDPLASPTRTGFQSLKGISGNWDRSFPLPRNQFVFQSLKGISGNWDVMLLHLFVVGFFVSIPKRD